jgi:ribosomal protein S18 acetylase RimI-like enzyme
VPPETGARIGPLAPRDLPAARALLARKRERELLDRALTGTPECTALAATRAGSGALAGIVLFGEVAGAAGAGTILWVAVPAPARRAGIARAMIAAAVEALGGRGTRLVVAELPSDREHEPGMALLRRSGFVREASVPDFYRDGVALTVWTRRLE